MRTMSASLQAALKGYDLQPAVAVTVGDVPPETARFAELAQAYGGSEPDVPGASCSLANGQIARAYLSGGTLYAQVVTPGGGASWGTWTAVATAQSAYTGVCHVAIGCASGSNAPRLYAVNSTGYQVYEWVWSGASWTSVGHVGDALSEIGGLAVDCVSADRPVFFGEIAGPLRVCYWNGAAWVASNDGGIYTPITVAASWSSTESKTRVMLTTGNPTVISTLTWSKLGGFSALTALVSAGSGTGYSYKFVGMQAPRNSSGRWVFTWNQTAPAPLGSSPIVAFTSQVDQITGAVPWNHGGSYGVNCFLDQAGATWWLSTPSQVWSVAADTASVPNGQRITFASSQVFAIDIDGRVPNRPTRAKITLLNEGGYLATAGQVGAYLGLRPWSQVVVSLGYHTGQGAGGQGFAAGDEGCWQVPLWIEAVIFHDETGLGVPLVTLECVDCWGVLDELSVRASQTVSGLTCDRLAKNLWWHVSGDSVSASPASLTGLTPASFTLRAGDPVGAHLRRIADLCGVAFVFGTFATSQSGVGWDSVSCRGRTYGDSSNGTDWTFGGAAGQPVVQSEIAVSTISSANGAEVVGASTTSITRNYTAQVWLTWRDRRARMIDKTLDNQTKTDRVSASLAGLLELERRGGSLQCYGNPGIEVGDIVSVTIATAPLSATLFVVAGVRQVYQRDLSGAGSGPTGRYLTTLYLEGVY